MLVIIGKMDAYQFIFIVIYLIHISGNRSIIIRTVNINKTVVSLPQPSYRAAQHNPPLQPCNSTQPQLCNSPRPYSQQQLSLMLLLAPAVRHKLLCLSGIKYRKNDFISIHSINVGVGVGGGLKLEKNQIAEQ